MTRTLSELRALGVFSALDVRFAEAMQRLAQRDRKASGSTEDCGEIALALALASRSVAHGHVCLDLAALCERPSLLDASGAMAPLVLPKLDAWIAALKQSPLVSDGCASTPLVLDEQHRLYLHRYYVHQRQLAESLRAHAHRVEGAALDPALLDRLFPKHDSQPDRQRQAVEIALTHRLSVITGGPGTGKTTTVVKLMAALVEQHRAAARPVPRMLLVAPTGKAAARLSESIAAQKPRLDCSEATRAAITEQASTIHRALGPRGDSATRFRHDADHPLVYDLVVIDEASMVDLPLMRRMLDAVPAHARVVLLGDADQLASVEAGAVLGDVCDAARTSGPLQPCLIELTRSHRYQEGSGIGQLAQLVRAGDAASAISLLTSGVYDDIRWHDTTEGGALVALQNTATQSFLPLRQAQTAEQALQALGRFRVLCALRQGPSGVAQLNPLVERMLAVNINAQPHYPWQPILITRNDHRLRLYNGDVGIVRAREAIVGNNEEAAGSLVATFQHGTAGLRDVSLARLPAHETVYAMSVHKSQGSELDHVCVVLPDQPSRVLTRELLYTAITRAKQRVEIIAPKAVLRAAITDKVARASGLTDMLMR